MLTRIDSGAGLPARWIHVFIGCDLKASWSNDVYGADSVKLQRARIAVGTKLERPLPCREPRDDRHRGGLHSLGCRRSGP